MRFTVSRAVGAGVIDVEWRLLTELDVDVVVVDVYALPVAAQLPAGVHLRVVEDHHRDEGLLVERRDEPLGQRPVVARLVNVRRDVLPILPEEAHVYGDAVAVTDLAPRGARGGEGRVL